MKCEEPSYLIKTYPDGTVFVQDCKNIKESVLFHPNSGEAKLISAFVELLTREDN